MFLELNVLITIPRGADFCHAKKLSLYTRWLNMGKRGLTGVRFSGFGQHTASGAGMSSRLIDFKNKKTYSFREKRPRVPSEAAECCCGLILHSPEGK